MSFIQAAVYAAPKPNLPHLAVLVMPSGEVIAKPVPDIATGEVFLEKFMEETAARLGLPLQER